ncbi:phosphogluconate dehydrogenase C-terminal domain-containing protein [Phaeobacter sp. B1627]|uniref:phosphogluconate dehydrogenase C-terminal domain-containing protein n=1 Tax=Phaeobacter sp. B1627 TaxID=2583809 RepID=UPI0011191136|nr:phosphogluconate dehydrogenase C-terminal domain-containing protein [Phaeobacter sp. B1627]TNJ39954.1 semialdehyde dehydrogenase [Phaeobacter sp. B1627]
MTNVAVFGAGGKMGVRCSLNLTKTNYDVAHVEVSEAGRARLKEAVGVDCVEVDAAIETADVVLLAVPDTAIGGVAKSIVDKLNPGTMVVILDAAAPFAGHLPERADITYFVTHPCHPMIFHNEAEEAARLDRFGGVAHPQGVVNALMQGPEEHYALGDEISKAIYAPVRTTYRVTVEQMAYLEPGLSETVCASLLVVLKQAMDEVVKTGVSEACARDFLLGHMNILGSVIFGVQEGVFSDACNKAIKFGIPALMREDWKNVFERDEIMASIRRIT